MSDFPSRQAMNKQSSSSLCGRLAVVTGASSGIGRAVAADLAAAGAKVVINARRTELLASLEKELNKKETSAVSVVGDASDVKVIEKLFQTAESFFQRAPDTVIVNAGRGLYGSLTNAKLEEFEEVVRTNLLGAAHLMRKAAEVLTGDSDREPFPARARDIVVLGSVAGRHISPFSSVYGSTKFAVSSLTEALRRELAPKGIRVTLIEPAIVLSGFQKVAGYDEEWRRNYAEKYGPLLEPQDIAGLIRFIISRPPHVHLSNVLIRPVRQEYP